MEKHAAEAGAWSADAVNLSFRLSLHRITKLDKEEFSLHTIKIPLPAPLLNF
jgi:hypothetical protein